MMFDLQALVDGMSAQWQRERAATQMTLGKLIAKLAAMPPEQRVESLGNPHSYRGYYSDFALSRVSDEVTAGSLLAECRDCMGEVFEGYKGGDFVMGSLTPVWVADYGCCGDKLMDINEDGTLVTAPEEQ